MYASFKGTLLLQIVALCGLSVMCVDLIRDPESPIGLSVEYPADAQVTKVIEKVKGEVEEKLGKTLDVYEAIAYKMLVQMGTTYFVKVRIGANDYIHISVISSRGPLFLGSVVQENKTLEDKIENF